MKSLLGINAINTLLGYQTVGQRWLITSTNFPGNVITQHAFNGDFTNRRWSFDLDT